MKNFLLIGLTATYLFLSGCSTVPTDDIKVISEAEPKANFSGYKTYAWLGSAGVLLDPEGKWKPADFDIDAEITFLIDKELRGRKMLETDKKPDLIVSYVLGINMAALKKKMDPKTEIEILKNVPQGALIVALVDTESGFIIWAASATAEIKNQGSEGSERAKKRLEYAISQMFKQLPK